MVREQNDGQSGVLHTEGFRQLQPRSLAQANVEEHEPRQSLGDECQCLRRIERLTDGISIPTQDPAQHVTEDRIVFDN